MEGCWQAQGDCREKFHRTCSEARGRGREAWGALKRRAPQTGRIRDEFSSVHQNRLEGLLKQITGSPTTWPPKSFQFWGVSLGRDFRVAADSPGLGPPLETHWMYRCSAAGDPSWPRWGHILENMWSPRWGACTFLDPAHLRNLMPGRTAQSQRPMGCGATLPGFVPQLCLLRSATKWGKKRSNTSQGCYRNKCCNISLWARHTVKSVCLWNKDVESRCLLIKMLNKMQCQKSILWCPISEQCEGWADRKTSKEAIMAIPVEKSKLPNSVWACCGRRLAADPLKALPDAQRLGFFGFGVGCRNLLVCFFWTTTPFCDIDLSIQIITLKNSTREVNFGVELCSPEIVCRSPNL